MIYRALECDDFKLLQDPSTDILNIFVWRTVDVS
jgi:hypothetical protein